MRTRFSLIGVTSQGATDRVGRVSIIIDYQVRMPSRAVEPAVNFLVVLFDRRTDGPLGGFAIAPGRGSRDVALVTESLPKFSIRASNVFAKRVAAPGFVLREITDRRRRSWLFFTRRFARGWGCGGSRLSRLTPPGRQQQRKTNQRLRPSVRLWISSHTSSGVEHDEGPRCFLPVTKAGGGHVTAPSSLPPCVWFWQLGGA